ncbi:FAD-binding oxidoreductase [Aliiruegeria lutimaris]|uniref:FAD/FMN-containing dehydrogenase n=1 Tax=Aliiruegeria lutimaris TaxID=571298 RepID=A0A1G8Z6T4_9RHOB|nr:FAD-binding oxidoreductase [Aliiruegeria lutimaris]SDK10663.1 FAD/FMN-containing dehydrogenase [Aliiruegeria lutimaris]
MLNPASEQFETSLRAALPEACFRPLEPRYLEEPRGRFRARDALLLTPGSTAEVSEILRQANAARVAVIPYGGGTGLVGGQVGVGLERPVLLSLERMNTVRSVHPAENLLIAEGGVILSNVHAAADAAGRIFPLSLASEGSAQIGGLLGTNAGGVNMLRYGNARELCLGIEAVLADGSVMHGLKRLRKDNTGYDLRNLLIGSEGTLGVITAACLRLFSQPASRGTTAMVVRSPRDALTLLSQVQGRLGEGISAFELIHRTGLEFLAEVMPQVRLPFAQAPEWMVLLEIGLSGGLDADTALEQIFVEAAEAGVVLDGVMTSSDAQRDALWQMRESIPEANRLIGAITSHDISVPIETIPDFIPQAWERVQAIGPFRVNCFGHLGDGNLHFNTYPPKGEDRDRYSDWRVDISRQVHDLVQEYGGSVSAEHGIGRLKVGDLERYGDPGKLAAMRAIKTALDPAGILNPGVVLRAG